MLKNALHNPTIFTTCCESRQPARPTKTPCATFQGYGPRRTSGPTSQRRKPVVGATTTDDSRPPSPTQIISNETQCDE
ncbi:MAG: hypothetical protein Aurels2KO_12380 [Aureliella sp.]